MRSAPIRFGRPLSLDVQDGLGDDAGIAARSHIQPMHGNSFVALLAVSRQSGRLCGLPSVGGLSAFSGQAPNACGRGAGLLFVGFVGQELDETMAATFKHDALAIRAQVAARVTSV